MKPNGTPRRNHGRLLKITREERAFRKQRRQRTGRVQRVLAKYSKKVPNARD